MLRIGVVGDLSQQDPALLARALDAALAASDVVLQLGDIHGAGDDRAAYDVVLARMASTGKLHPVPGNHDAEGGRWDAYMVDPHTGVVGKQWALLSLADAILVGLDNSGDHFDGAAWSLLNSAAAEAQARPRPIFVAVHKALSPLVLVDGSESRHIMAEGATCPDAEALAAWVKIHGATVCCGHYHGAAVMQTGYGTVILEGRGGAAGAGDLGYTLILVQPEGWTAHAVRVGG